MVFWDIVAPVYDLFISLNKAHKQMIHATRLLIPQGAKVLELAGGTGDISIAISNKADEVLCTDISESMLKIAKRKAKKHNLNNIYFEKISIYETGKQDNSFDAVIASQILHLTDEPKKAGAEIRRIAKNIAVLPTPLLKEAPGFGKFLIKLYKIFGFSPKYELDRSSCKTFFEEIGFNNCEYHVIEGTIPLCMAIWRAK